jgi:signal transduction histidine kinase
MEREKIIEGPARKGGLRRRLLIWNLVLLGLTLISVILASYIFMQRQTRRDSAELQSEIATVTANRIDAFINRKIERLSDSAVSMSLYRLGSEEQRLLAILLLKNDRAFTEASILDSKGMELIKVSERRVYIPSELSDQSMSAKFKKAIRGENYVSPVYTSDKAEPYVTLAVPLYVTPQDVAGVVSAEAYLKFLWEIIGRVRFGAAGYAYLVDSQGNLIAHEDPSLVLKRINLSQIPAVQKFIHNPTLPDPAPAREEQGITGRPVLSTYAPVRGLGWAVILEEPVDAALANVKLMERFALLLLGIGLFVGAFVVIWVSNKITEPIRELHRGARIIGSGNLKHRVEIKTGDEIEWLAGEFNKMTEELNVSYSTLEEKVEQRTRELSALYDVTTTVNQSLELDPVLQEVIKKITWIFHFDATRIFLFNSTGSQLHLRASFETRPEFWTDVRVFQAGQGIVGKVAKTGEPLIFENILSDPRYHELSHTKLYQKVGLISLAVFPIRAKVKCVGSLVCNSQVPRRLALEEVNLLTSMANQIGVAVENADLFAALKNKTTELEKANLDLQEASRIKSEFMAAMSHELRTPLNVIVGNVELLNDGFFGEITEEQRQSLQIVTRHAQVLLKLISDVLTLTKMEARKMALEVATIQLGEIITNVKGYVDQLSRNGHLKILWEVEPNLPPIITDALKLEEILQNLIGNAYKFTPKGRIEIRARDLKGENRIEFAVADTGIGIREKDLEKIFDEFHQLKEAHTANFSGVGLGLSIVKKYLELMQGEIRVESRPGVGSTFTFTLPYSLQLPSNS